MTAQNISLNFRWSRCTFKKKKQEKKLCSKFVNHELNQNLRDVTVNPWEQVPSFGVHSVAAYIHGLTLSLTRSHCSVCCRIKVKDFILRNLQCKSKIFYKLSFCAVLIYMLGECNGLCLFSGSFVRSSQHVFAWDPRARWRQIPLPLTFHDLKQITLSHGLLSGKWATALLTSEKVLWEEVQDRYWGINRVLLSHKVPDVPDVTLHPSPRGAR